MPHPCVTGFVRMGISRENIFRHITCQRPLPGLVPGGGEPEFQIREVAGMLGIAWSDNQGNEVSRLHGHIVDWSERRGLSTVRHPFGEALPCGAMSQFHSPGYSVATGGMRVRHDPLHTQRCLHGALPSDGHGQCWCGMHDDSMGFHVPGDFHHLVRGICHQSRKISRAPAFHKIIVARFFVRRGQMIQLDLTAGTDPKETEPFLERFGIHAVFGRERW